MRNVGNLPAYAPATRVRVAGWEVQCLRCETPITDDALGAGADPLIRGLTLAEIVNSEVVARADGQLCSSCHHAGSAKPYSPGAGTLTPGEDVGGRTWAESGGWADEFIRQTVKPNYLKQAFQRWLDDGAL